jgi:tetratricopeptide (TPR) repeat protein
MTDTHGRVTFYAVPVAALIVAALTALFFLPVLGHDFLRYDDEVYVYENPFIQTMRPENVAVWFTQPYFNSWTPLALFSHALDVAIWGMNPRGHHLTSYLLHVVNALWIYALALLVLGMVPGLARGPRDAGGAGRARALPVVLAAAGAALLYALHPLRVESVAWISDRKDLLLGFFLFPSTIAYIRFAAARGTAPARRWYLLALGLFVLAVLSKTAAISAPLAFLAIDLLLVPGTAGHSDRRRLLLDAAPFLAVSAAAGVIGTLAVSEQRVAYVIDHLGALELALLPLHTASFYLLKMLWPSSLAPVYVAPTSTEGLLTGALSIAVTVFVFRMWRKGNPLPLLAWAVYLLALLPTMTGLRAGIQPWADRYTYAAMPALCILAAGWAASIWMKPPPARARVAPALLLGTALAAYAAVSASYLPVWKTSGTLWRHAAAAHPNAITTTCLGIALYHEGDFDAALDQYRKAIALEPNFASAHYNLGRLYEERKEDDLALAAYRHVLLLDSTSFAANTNLGNILLRRGEPGAAIGHYERAIREQPSYPYPYYNIGVAWERKGDRARAEEAYRTAIRVNPDFVDPYVNLAVLANSRGEQQIAVELLREALQIRPDDSKALYNSGVILEQAGQIPEAERAYAAALRSDTSSFDAAVNLCNVLVLQGRLPDAESTARRIIAMAPDSVEGYNTLGYVRFLGGDMQGAADWFRRAVERKPDFADPHLNLGVALEKLGDSEGSRTALQRAAALGSGAAKQRLEKTGGGG